METIIFLQQTLMNFLTENDEKIIENVYITPKRNSSYPYLIIENTKFEKKSNLKEKLFSVNFAFKIFDKDVDKKNDILLDNSKKIQEKILSLKNFSNDDFYIKNINLFNLKLNLFNEVNLVWESELEFNFLIKRNNGK